jgi:hypothetical protein
MRIGNSQNPMNSPLLEPEVRKVYGLCRSCGTRAAEKVIPFWCAKKQELKPGVVPLYRFETPLCEGCITERGVRIKRRYWRTSLILTAVIIIAAFMAFWSSGPGNPKVTFLGRLNLTFSMAVIPGVVFFMFVGLISLLVCSRDFATGRLAIYDQRKALSAAGYTGFWVAPPKRLILQ